MKIKFNKLFFSLLVLCIALVGGGIFFNFTQVKQEAVPKQEDSKVVQYEDTKEEVSQKDKQLKAEKSLIHAPKNSESSPTNEQKERKEFNKEVLSQDYYVENVDSEGKLTYIKATEESLKLLESKAKDNQLSTYQVNYEGQFISVLTTS
ncbi:hypothetical protein [Lactococcus garvieae]|uniref:Uncharacterized protein n=1 Tax=Lactococcus garvieae TaxID=1363 RepID=A0AA46TVI3_9LACT|nr:hypothetical protein [Lactococcus garvieae]UYT10387.1 hypothetical protein OF801_00165 [Lactococcus garvieae]UYT12428.1 hypothetical protein OF800_00170 [Lactococcus garvieae]